MNAILILINGLETHNEKSARDAGVKRVPSRLQPGKTIALRSGKSRRVKHQRGLAHIVVRAGLTRAQIDLFAAGCSCRLVRIAPRRLHDTSESCPSALGAVRDGVADALGVDDRDAEEGGVVAWSYGQEQGPYGVRVEVRPRDPLPVVIPAQLAFSRSLHTRRTPERHVRARSSVISNPPAAAGTTYPAPCSSSAPTRRLSGAD